MIQNNYCEMLKAGARANGVKICSDSRVNKKLRKSCVKLVGLVSLFIVAVSLIVLFVR